MKTFKRVADALNQSYGQPQAVIEALRNPTDEELLAAGEPYSGEVDRATGLQIRREAWNKIIDQILKD